MWRSGMVSRCPIDEAPPQERRHGLDSRHPGDDLLADAVAGSSVAGPVVDLSPNGWARSFRAPRQTIELMSDAKLG